MTGVGRCLGYAQGMLEKVVYRGYGELRERGVRDSRIRQIQVSGVTGKARDSLGAREFRKVVYQRAPRRGEGAEGEGDSQVGKRDV